ncbi:MAG TPA: ABC transporter ATP-binding protein [Haloplasmataceae bacterium]
MDYCIEMLNITKTFPGIKANDNITLQVKKGEIHALLGENGAGKSTLMSILFGLYQPDEGIIKVNGKEVKIKNPNDANDLGIGMVHQHFKLVHNFTVLENIILGKEETKRGLLYKKNAYKKIMALCDKYKLRVNPYAYIQDISVGMQQRVEILKMLYRDADILIFDEPTAVLTPQEIDELIKIMQDLVKEGKSIILITHKLEEIKKVAHRCTILRKGKWIGTVDVKSVSTAKLAEMMVGRQVTFKTEKEKNKPGKTILEVRNLTLTRKDSDRPILNNVNFTVKSGEIVCLAGIEGNGQSELVFALTGLNPHFQGEVYLNGQDITKYSIRNKTRSGMGHIPEDRHKHGLILDYNLAENLVLQTYYSDEYQKRGFLKHKTILNYAQKLIEAYDIRSARGPYTITRNMSGGNQQKAIIAREIDRNPDLLIAVQPTRGLDIGAIEYIHKQLVKHRDNGKAVLLISLELDEVMNISDRILVMYEGEIVANLDPDSTTEKELGLYMAGSKRGDVANA